jgi:hypothetical protein
MKRPKSCPEQSEGTLEIATGYALAMTSGQIATFPLVARNDKTGLPSLKGGRRGYGVLISRLKIQSKSAPRLRLFCSGRQREWIQEFKWSMIFRNIIGKTVTIE